MSYRQSTFTFDVHSLRFCHDLKELKSAQKKAITSIELDPRAVQWYCYRNRGLSKIDLLGVYYKPLKNMFFPNLKRIIIGKLALEIWKFQARRWGVPLEIAIGRGCSHMLSA